MQMCVVLSYGIAFIICSFVLAHRQRMCNWQLLLLNETQHTKTSSIKVLLSSAFRVFDNDDDEKKGINLQNLCNPFWLGKMKKWELETIFDWLEKNSRLRTFALRIHPMEILFFSDTNSMNDKNKPHDKIG